MSAPLLHLLPLPRGSAPPADPRAWLSARARAAPGSDAPLAALAVAAGGQVYALQEGLGPGLLGVAEAALAAALPRRAWLGAVGSAVIVRAGRPLPVRWARCQPTAGPLWVALWHRSTPGPLSPAPDEVWTGPPSDRPRWLDPLFPAPVDGGVVDLTGPEGPLRRWPDAVEAPESRRPLPAPIDLPQLIAAIAEGLELRFTQEGKAPPSLHAWDGAQLLRWTRDTPAGLDPLARAIAADLEIRALGLSGLGAPPGAEGGGPALLLAIEARGGERAMWARRFLRSADGRARWQDPAGVLQLPGPPLGWLRV